MFKVYNKDTRTTSVTSFWCLYCKLWTYSTPCSSVSFKCRLRSPLRLSTRKIEKTKNHFGTSCTEGLHIHKISCPKDVQKKNCLEDFKWFTKKINKSSENRHQHEWCLRDCLKLADILSLKHPQKAGLILKRRRNKNLKKYKWKIKILGNFQVKHQQIFL